MQSFSNRQLAAFTAAAALGLLAWDVSGLDLVMAHWFGGPGGFPLRENWVLTGVLHDGVKRLAWALALGLCLGVWWPIGVLARLPFKRRLQLASTTLVAVLVISSLKTLSTASCPWGLSDFGGVAHYTPHWMHLLTPDGGSGGCFPAGHAASGFAFLGGYFAFRHSEPRVARRWLAASMGGGLLLGLAQQVRGAHFTSHTLWTAWTCWCVAWVIDVVCTHLNDTPLDAGMSGA
jgi:membrane-associated PAP2 superfamily phosphatase